MEHKGAMMHLVIISLNDLHDTHYNNVYTAAMLLFSYVARGGGESDFDAACIR